MQSFSFLKINFIYLFLVALGLCCCVGFSLVAVRGAAPFSLRWLLLLLSMASGHVGSVVVAH